jgi:DNA-binding transcriptional regulator LsrR (DeoR family)
MIRIPSLANTVSKAEQLARIARRIAVTVGIRKVDAILGASRSRLINALVTDVITASALMATFEAKDSTTAR